MKMLFTDFIYARGPNCGQHQDVPAGEEGESMWLAGMTNGAADTGSEVQYCMAAAHQVVRSHDST